MRRIASLAFAFSLVAIAPGVAQSDDCYNVGSWNLEHFGFGKTRGFPENTRGGPTYQAHTEAQRDAIARAIRDDIGFRILVLNEINGIPGERTSAELDDLTGRLGPSWQYAIGSRGGSGDSQRVALLWDKTFVRAVETHEIFIAFRKVQDDDIFNRDPLAGRFVFLKGGEPRNDLVVVGLHLASGQDNTKNHDAAMTRLRGELRALRGQHAILPTEEDDIVLAGDLNANAFDNRKEKFFETFNRGNWRVLAGEGYASTRLAGVPLRPGSPIDYILATTKRGKQAGLIGEEMGWDTTARVHTELIVADDYDTYRETYSDHLPVSICIPVVADTD